MKKYKFLKIVCFLFLLCVICMFNYSYNVSAELSNEVLRLHVIANSNDKNDQKVKLMVRDVILQYMQNNCVECTNKNEAIQFVKDNLGDIKNITKEVLLKNNFTYDVKFEIGTSYFPSKKYNNISFPAGEYEALKVKLGNAKGDNWWCVMFPPLCFINSNAVFKEEEEKILKSNLSQETFNVICEDSNEVKVKFKTIEIFNIIMQKLK